MKYLVLIVLIIFAMAILPSVQPTMEAWKAQEQANAQRLALDNEAKARGINERSTAAAGEAYATATGVALQAIATQTAVAISANGTAAANLQQATATARAQEVLVNATATAEIHNEGNATVNAYAQRGTTILGVVFIGVLVFTVFAFGVAASGWVSTKGKQIARDPGTGLALPIYDHGRVVNADTQIGNPFTILPDWRWKLYQLGRAILTGEWVNDPEPKVLGLGANATPEQLAAMQQRLLATTTARAVYSSVKTEQQHEKRTEGLRRLGGNALMVVPPTQVVDDNAIAQKISEAIADKLREENAIQGEATQIE